MSDDKLVQNLFARAIHECGHLVALVHFYGLNPDNIDVLWTTIEEYGTSGGCVGWLPKRPVALDKEVAVLLCGYYAQLAHCDDEQAASLAFSDDRDRIYKLSPSQEIAERADNSAVEITERYFLALPRIARELVRQRTFYGREGLAVVFAHTKQPRVRRLLKARIQQYRQERGEAMPPDSWNNRGPWYSPW